MPEKTLEWTVDHYAEGSELESAVEAMNAHGPFTCHDDVVKQAPRWAQFVDGRFQANVTLARRIHDFVATEVAFLLKHLVGDRGIAFGPCAVLTSQDRTIRGADVVAFLGVSASDLSAEQWTSHVPALVVEVLSPSTAHVDQGAKKTEYEGIGVQEYYILHPDTGEVLAYSLLDGNYQVFEADGEGRFASRVLETTWTPADAIP